MLEVSWEGVGAIAGLIGSMGGICFFCIRIGVMQGKFEALTSSVNRQGVEIGDLRNKLDLVAPAASLVAFDRRLETLVMRIDEGFRDMNNRIDQIRK